MFDARTSVRFWTKVAISAGGCAEWTGATYPNGYGEFHCNGRNHPAHRVAWLMAGRAIPACSTAAITVCALSRGIYLRVRTKKTWTTWPLRGGARRSLAL